MSKPLRKALADLVTISDRIAAAFARKGAKISDQRDALAAAFDGQRECHEAAREAIAADAGEFPELAARVAAMLAASGEANQAFYGDGSRNALAAALERLRQPLDDAKQYIAAAAAKAAGIAQTLTGPDGSDYAIINDGDVFAVRDLSSYWESVDTFATAADAAAALAAGGLRFDYTMRAVALESVLKTRAIDANECWQRFEKLCKRRTILPLWGQLQTAIGYLRRAGAVKVTGEGEGQKIIRA
jgi:hypothetical protein